MQVATLESDSQGAASRTKKLQEILDTREITGTRVYVGYYKGSEKEAKPLIAKLKSLGAVVNSSLNKQAIVLEKYRNKNSLLQPTLPDRGEQQLLKFARSEIEIESIINEDLPSFREPTQILLYK